MADDADTPFAAELRALMKERGLNKKALSLKAGLGETYVRDLLVGRSGGPQANKLEQLARALDVPAARLMNLAGAPAAAEIVKKPDELVLLRAWRKLTERDHEMVLDFIKFRLSASEARGEAV